jgi:tetratricopeptide (TPR) repeat protein
MNIPVEKAIELLEARLKDNAKSLVFARLADMYLAQGRIDEAISLCNESTKFHPYYVTGHFVLAKAYVAKKDLEKAETSLKKVLSHDQQYLAAHKLLGDILAKTNRDSLALPHYEDILHMDPIEEKAQKALNRLSKDIVKPVPKPVEPPEMNEPVAESISEPSDESWMDQIKEFYPEKKGSSGAKKEETPVSENEIRDPFSNLPMFEPKEETIDQAGKESPQEKELHLSQASVEDQKSAEPPIQNAEPLIGQSFFDELEKPTKMAPPYDIPEIKAEDIPGLVQEEPSVPSPDLPISSQAKTSKLYPTSETEATPPTATKAPEDSGIPRFFPEPGLLDDAVLAAEPTILDEEPTVKEIESDAVSLSPKPAAPTIPKSPEPPVESAQGKIPAEPKTIPKPSSMEEKKLPKIVTPTLGEIYAAQGQFEKAIKVYETLLEKNPGDKKYLDKIEDMKKKLRDSMGR